MNLAYRPKQIPHAVYNLEVEDGLILTYDKDLNVTGAEVWAPTLGEWLDCTDKMTWERIRKYSLKMMDHINLEKGSL